MIDTKDIASASIQERSGFLQQMLKMETNDSFGGLQAVRERARKGIGSVWLFSHNAINDGLATLAVAKGDPIMADKELVMPMSSELFYKGYRFGQRPLGVKFFPIHTPQVRKKRDKNPVSGLLSYLRDSRRVLQSGGMVALAPQAQGNLGRLDMTRPMKAFSLFMDFMGRRLDADLSVIPLGISYPESVRMGRSQKGMHIGERMRVDVGRCYTKDQVFQEAQKQGVDVDRWIYGKLAALLPNQVVKRS